MNFVILLFHFSVFPWSYNAAQGRG